MSTEQFHVEPKHEDDDEFLTQPVLMQVEIGRFDPSIASAARTAFAIVAEEWDDRSPAYGGSTTARYSFELDGHRFEVSVAPVKP